MDVLSLSSFRLFFHSHGKLLDLLFSFYPLRCFAWYISIPEFPSPVRVFLSFSRRSLLNASKVCDFSTSLPLWFTTVENVSFKFSGYKKNWKCTVVFFFSPFTEINMFPGRQVLFCSLCMREFQRQWLTIRNALMAFFFPLREQRTGVDSWKWVSVRFIPFGALGIVFALKWK